jgi:hypothetical protein
LVVVTGSAKYVPITVSFVSSLVTRLQSAEKALVVALWD